jgi:hypothetical protein
MAPCAQFLDEVVRNRSMLGKLGSFILSLGSVLLPSFHVTDFRAPVNKDVPPPCAQRPVPFSHLTIYRERPGNWPAWGPLQVGTIYSPAALVLHGTGRIHIERERPGSFVHGKEGRSQLC